MTALAAKAPRTAKRWTVKIQRTQTATIQVAAYTPEEAALKAETMGDLDCCEWFAAGEATATNCEEGGE